MIHRKSKRWATALFSMFALLTFAGYHPTAEEATPTPDTGMVSTSAATVEADITFGSGSFDLPSPATGLSELDSYRATLTISFKGKQANKPSQWTQTYVMLANQEPFARQMTITTVGKGTAQVVKAIVNGARYERRDGAACEASLIEDDVHVAGMELAEFLNGVIGANEAASETINNVTANHFTFDEHALGPQVVAPSTGELWVAADGGYVLKYVLVTTGNADHFGEGVEGTLSWEYVLSDINQPVAIQEPDGCPGGRVEAPMLSDATNVSLLPGVLSYNTASSLIDAAAFYKKELVALGWQFPEQADIGETRALMEFSKADQRLSVFVSTTEGQTRVDIILASVPQAPTKVPTRTPIPTKTKAPTRTPPPTKTPVPTKTKPPTRTLMPTKTPRP